MDLDEILQDIDVICFDLFDTLIEIPDKKYPFAPLNSLIPPDKRKSFREVMMTRSISVEEIPEFLGIEGIDGIIQEVRSRLDREVSSARERSGVSALLSELSVRGIPYGICSNLSADYLQALENTPAICPNFKVMSCEVGVVKPKPEIYRIVARRAGATPSRILFSGDNQPYDVVAPSAAGFSSMQIDALIEACEREQRPEL